MDHSLRHERQVVINFQLDQQSSVFVKLQLLLWLLNIILKMHVSVFPENFLLVMLVVMLVVMNHAYVVFLCLLEKFHLHNSQSMALQIWFLIKLLHHDDRVIIKINPNPQHLILLLRLQQHIYELAFRKYYVILDLLTKQLQKKTRALGSGHPSTAHTVATHRGYETPSLPNSRTTVNASDTVNLSKVACESACVNPSCSKNDAAASCGITAPNTSLRTDIVLFSILNV
mmetsp:Transcript_15277/g.22958  ORF Transcript_15277/g.22958 Transcript_15277/m.22958 type:complete len:229 (+) Transcript_15277:186-872(+)